MSFRCRPCLAVLGCTHLRSATHPPTGLLSVPDLQVQMLRFSKLCFSENLQRTLTSEEEILLCVRNLVLKQNNKSRMWAPPHPVSLDFLTLNIPLSPASVTSLLSPRVLPFDSLLDWIAVSSSPVAPSLASSHLSLPYMAVSPVFPPFGSPCTTSMVTSPRDVSPAPLS